LHYGGSKTSEIVDLKLIGGVDFGSGAVAVGSDFATIDTLGNVVDGNWTATTTKFFVTNVGNTNVTMNLSSGKDADTLLGGNASISSYQYNISNNNTGACVPPAGFSLDTFYEVNATPDARAICDYFLPGQNITIDLKLVIPKNSNLGALTDALSITYQQSS